jgi:hypothetical protein
MYGTIARLKVSKANLEALRATLEQAERRPVEGFVGSHLLIPDQWNDEAYLVVFFTDKDAYFRNADDPAQHEAYLAFRAHLDADPGWTDGVWHSMSPSP